MTNISKFFLGFFIIYSSILQLSAQGGRIPVSAKNGMVVSSHYLASEVGKTTLAQGGTAVDASIATAFALSVTLPAAGNIGGGGFLVYHGGETEITTFNFREKAPLAATRDMYLNKNGKIKNNSNHEGLLSVGVPGTVAGLYKAHQRLGKLEWSKLVQPAIDIAEKGFPVSPSIVEFSQWVFENKEEYASTAKIFLKDGMVPFEKGDILVQKDLGETLKRIRDKGADGFYKGKTANLIADYMNTNKGIITKEDLKRYEAEEMKPIKGTYREYDIIGMPPPSSGGVAIVEMLNILENFDLKQAGHNSAASLHYITEAMRRGFADRALYIGDLNYNEQIPLQELTSKEYANKLTNSIQEKKASTSDSANFNKAHLAYESPQTTHLSVVDTEGNAVSLTYTLEQSFGSKIIVEGAGFLLNNEMGDFNAIVAKNGKPVIIIGSPGGRTIINTVLQVILNVIDYDMNIAKAIETPRMHHQWLPDVTYFEEWGFSPDTQCIYKEMGHDFEIRSSQGRAMGIYINPETGMLEGAADSRSFDGEAVGY